MIRRIILHGGTPKTGTTSLQVALSRQRAALAGQGIFVPPSIDQLYPAADGTAAAKPKHQFLVGAMMSQDGRRIRARLAEALATAPDDAHTAVLSTEGLYHHWWDFSPAARDSLAAMARERRIELWVWFRDPMGFFISNYIQMLKNPVGPVACYGQDWSAERMLDDEWFARRLDYAGFVADAARLLGRDSLRLFAWRGTTVRDFLVALGCPAADAGELREHATPGAVGVGMLRLVNAAAVPNETKSEVVRMITRIDSALGPASPRFVPARETEARVRAMTAPGLAMLRQEWGLDLRGAAS